MWFGEHGRNFPFDGLINFIVNHKTRPSEDVEKEILGENLNLYCVCVYMVVEELF